MPANESDSRTLADCLRPSKVKPLVLILLGAAIASLVFGAAGWSGLAQSRSSFTACKDERGFLYIPPAGVGVCREANRVVWDVTIPPVAEAAKALTRDAVVIVTKNTTVSSPDDRGQATYARCPLGYTAIAGGYYQHEQFPTKILGFRAHTHKASSQSQWSVNSMWTVPGVRGSKSRWVDVRVTCLRNPLPTLPKP